MTIRATGKVERLYVKSDVTYIRLEIPQSERPADGYFGLNLANPNYNALYSLALSAAVNGYLLQIRTVADIKPTETAVVEYMVIDW